MGRRARHPISSTCRARPRDSLFRPLPPYWHPYSVLQTGPLCRAVYQHCIHCRQPCRLQRPLAPAPRRCPGPTRLPGRQCRTMPRTRQRALFHGRRERGNDLWLWRGCRKGLVPAIRGERRWPPPLPAARCGDKHLGDSDLLRACLILRCCLRSFRLMRLMRSTSLSAVATGTSGEDEAPQQVRSCSVYTNAVSIAEKIYRRE